jgi:hypothetical protein
VVFVPALLRARKERFFLVLYFALVVFGFLNSVSRTMLITCTVVPTAIYLRANLRAHPTRTIVTGLVMAGMGLMITLFGKDFGQAVRVFFSDNSVASVNAQHYDGSVLEALLRQFEYQWFSIRAGIHSFTTHGPILPDDLPLSLIGFVPSAIMQWAGLGAFRYNEVEQRFACINTAHMGLPDCTVPALFMGYSAYVAPIAAGLAFGFIRNFVLGRAEAAWRYIAARDYSKTWLPYLIAILVTNVFLFIPNFIATTSLIIVVAGAGMAVKRVFSRRRWRQSTAPINRPAMGERTIL